MTAAGTLATVRAKQPGRLRRDLAPDFRALVGGAAWAQLPPAVRARFDHAAHLTPRAFPGRMYVRMTALGWVFAQACRLIGAPLAPWRGEDVPVVVGVRAATDGAVVWERRLAFPGRKSLAIASRKELAEDGSLLEVTRGGLGMRLAVNVEAGALVFRSLSYFWRIGGARLPVPGFLTPGRACVVHRDLGDGRFRFELSFTHPLAGVTFESAGDFEDPKP